MNICDFELARPGGRSALATARRAWEWHGFECSVVETTDSPGIAGVLAVPGHRYSEVVVEQADDLVWEALAEWSERSGQWRMRAIVPLPALGVAHEVLRDHDCELQGYWFDEVGRAVFGSVERA